MQGTRKTRLLATLLRRGVSHPVTRRGTASANLPQLAAVSVAASQPPQGAEAASPPFLSWAAAALLAGSTAATATAALCESDSSGTQGPGSGPEAESWLAAARSALAPVWRELDDSLHRHEATLPAGFTLARPCVPTIGTVNGRLSVRIPVRPGADPTAVLVDVVAGLCGSRGDPANVTDGAVRLKVAECGAARVFSLEPNTASAVDTAKALMVQVHLPKAGRGQSLVEFLKRGPLTPEEVKAIGGAMRAANTIESADAGLQVKPFEDFLEGALQDMARMFPGGEELLGQLGGALGSLPRGTFEWQFGRGDDQNEEQGAVRLPPPLQQIDPGRDAGLRSGKDAATPSAAYDYGSPEANRAVEKLTKMGCLVHPPGNADTTDWGMLAGYADQKQVIQDGLLGPLMHPEVYDALAAKTRKTPASNRPRAVLFEGPPGCGKTTSARVIATQAAVPLVYVPLEGVSSKWYGESEKLLADVFRAAETLGGAILFFDEIDSLATARSSDMHEATRKLLGVLLREMDGFDAGKKSIVIGATNRRSDLDPALLSRFDTSIAFPLPDEACRADIMRTYAQQLSDAELRQLAAATAGLSGRDLRDIASRTERTWASKIIRNEVPQGELPTADVYMQAAREQSRRRAADQSGQAGRLFGTLPMTRAQSLAG